ncbi:MAG: hypothetical protein JNK05_25155 [Myxococcales bacterium]|nr:hypothetical protein [Myxococcales bacterium]
MATSTQHLALVAIVSAATLTACSRSFTGTWRGSCEVEITPMSDPNAQPTTEQRAVEITVTKEDGKYRMRTRIGDDTTCEQGGGEPTTNGARQLWFSAMPCAQFMGSSLGGYGSQILSDTSRGMAFSGTLSSPPRSGGRQLRVDGSRCTVTR